MIIENLAREVTPQVNIETLYKEIPHKGRTVEELITYITTKICKTSANYSLLLGAGASVTSGIKSGQDLVEIWREEVYKRYNPTSVYDKKSAVTYFYNTCANWYNSDNEYSSLFEKKFDLASQRRRFVEQQVEPAFPSIGYSYLVSLANGGHVYFDTIYTTNFDDLINESFYQFSHTRPILCAHDSSVNSLSINSTRPKIIKLHGDYLYDDIKSTLRETETLEANIKNKLIEFSKEYGLIVVGYSGGDRSIMDVLNHLLKNEDYFKNGIYWCLRKDDYVNPELRKLLWKDRVYFVEIDGFDELMASIHNATKGKLSLDESFGDSKKERILKSFTDDEYNLKETSSIICDDIGMILKRQNNKDIGSLIAEISRDSDTNFNSDISDEDFKKLLSIDGYIKHENYSEAESILKKLITDCDDEDLYVTYLFRLIKIYFNSGNESQSINFAEKLVESDPYNFQFFMRRLSLEKSPGKRCELLIENKGKFERNYKFYNVLVSNGLLQREESMSKHKFSHKTLIDYCNKSIELNPSISNSSWHIKLEVLEKMHTNPDSKTTKKDEETDINNILRDLKKINAHHIETFKIKAHDFILKNKIESLKTLINEIESEYKISSKNKRNSLIDILCDTCLSLNDYSEDDTYKHEFKKIMGLELIKDNSHLNSVILLKIIYSINVQVDTTRAYEEVEKLIKHKEGYEYASKIINFLVDIFHAYDRALNYLESIKDKISRSDYYLYMHEINLARKDHKEAIRFLESSYKFGLEKHKYITAMAFANLISSDFERVISWVDMNMDDIGSTSQRDTLIINREYAKKSLGRKVDTTALNTVVSHKNGSGHLMCANVLLGKETQAKAIFDKNVSHCKYNFYGYKKWPIIPEYFFKKYNDNMKELDCA
ncbi:SIR2 family protein [Photobacterium sagamiensis]|uniref:SIR2 family protein n=1 Tax=Photobacterium sagamiensis TaxID=2910241 RepID=UPI003D14C3CE